MRWFEQQWIPLLNLFCKVYSWDFYELKSYMFSQYIGIVGDRKCLLFSAMFSNRRFGLHLSEGYFSKACSPFVSYLFEYRIFFYNRLWRNPTRDRLWESKASCTELGIMSSFRTSNLTGLSLSLLTISLFSSHTAIVVQSDERLGTYGLRHLSL